jgi:hypothetical protein
MKSGAQNLNGACRITSCYDESRVALSWSWHLKSAGSFDVIKCNGYWPFSLL